MTEEQLERVKDKTKAVVSLIVEVAQLSGKPASEIARVIYESTLLGEHKLLSGQSKA